MAAAVASIFSIRLQEKGYEGAELLIPITFSVIIGTVMVYGLSSPWLAFRLGVADRNPQGVLLLGAYRWARDLAELLRDKGFQVLLVDSNRENIAEARMAGLPTYSGSILAEYAIAEMQLGGIGRLLALTPNDWVNTLTVQRFTSIFGREECYQLPPHNEPTGQQTRHKHLHGRWLFAEGLTYTELETQYEAGAVPKATTLSDEFNFAAFQDLYGASAIPLFVITESNNLKVAAVDTQLDARPGQTIISLVFEPEKVGK